MMPLFSRRVISTVVRTDLAEIPNRDSFVNFESSGSNNHLLTRIVFSVRSFQQEFRNFNLNSQGSKDLSLNLLKEETIAARATWTRKIPVSHLLMDMTSFRQAHKLR